MKPVFASNHDWAVKSGPSAKPRPFKEYLEEHLGPVSFYLGGQDGMPYKPQAAAVGHILQNETWTRRGVVYVGNSDNDMRTARNGDVLFLNALWHETDSPYGYQFSSPKDVARFVDCFCLGLTSWFWILNEGKLRVFAMAPFTTLSPGLTAAHAYSANAKATAKEGAGDATFWGRLLAARIYFSGLVDEIDYIAAYPGHSPTSKQTVIADALTILAQSLQHQYLPDLIIRHAKALKSQSTRTSGGSVDVHNQLSTIHLNRSPKKGPSGDPYKNNPLRKGKTVLVVDDICTQGNSFEAARAFIEKTGADAICVSWLKTINRDYDAIAGSVPMTNAYVPYKGTDKIPVASHSYRGAIVDPGATTDLAEVHESYQKWDWPPSSARRFSARK